MEAISHIILKNLVFRISYSQPAGVKIPWLNQEQKSAIWKRSIFDKLGFSLEIGTVKPL